MGFVYRAEHARLGRPVALKLLRPEYASRQEAVSRFFQEAKTVNRIRHRNIVEVTDFVELDDGVKFIVMELLQGQKLGGWTRTGIDGVRLLGVLVQVCDGLAAAHAVGVVHRGLKPDDIIVTPNPDGGGDLVKLFDFGIAKLLDRGPNDVAWQTIAGSLIGTPAYMAPEQASAEKIDHRADIYALGVIMYELFCGEPLFTGSLAELVHKHREIAPRPPRQTRVGANLDEQLERVILRCLAKRPDDRFATMLELRDELLRLQQRAVTLATLPPAPHGSDLAESAATLPRNGEPVRIPDTEPSPLPPTVSASPTPAMLAPTVSAAPPPFSDTTPLAGLPDTKPSRPPLATATPPSDPRLPRDAPKLQGLLKEWKPYLLPQEQPTGSFSGLSSVHTGSRDPSLRRWLVAAALICTCAAAIIVWLAVRSADSGAADGAGYSTGAASNPMTHDAAPAEHATDTARAAQAARDIEAQKQAEADKAAEAQRAAEADRAAEAAREAEAKRVEAEKAAEAVQAAEAEHAAHTAELKRVEGERPAESVEADKAAKANDRAKKAKAEKTKAAEADKAKAEKAAEADKAAKAEKAAEAEKAEKAAEAEKADKAKAEADKAARADKAAKPDKPDKTTKASSSTSDPIRPSETLDPFHRH
jgi:serine/threonine protein kinase